MRVPTMLSFVLAVVLTAASARGQAPQFTIQDLGGDSASLSFGATGINQNGVVVGYTVSSSGQALAFRTKPNAAPDLPADYLGTLGGSSSWATGVNTAGQVVGYSTTLNGEIHGFRTAPNAIINPSTDDLGSLGGPPNSKHVLTKANAINDSGQVTGVSQGTNGEQAFRTAPNSAINPATDSIPYPSIPYGDLTGVAGLSINSGGDVLGEYFNLNVAGYFQPFVAYHDGTITTIPSFHYAPFNGFTGINDQGQVAGNSGKLYVWQNGTSTPLADCAFCAPSAINNASQVIGFGNDGTSAPFLYSSGNIYNLNNVIPPGSDWGLGTVSAINDQGQIIGRGTLNGVGHAFRLDPVPVMPPGPISLVQSASVSGSALPSISVAFPSLTTKGNLIVAFVRMSTTSQSVSVSDTAGNTYIDAVSQGQAADGHQVHIFYTSNLADGANTVKAKFSGTNNHPFLAVYEYSGVTTLDRIAAAQGYGASPSSGATPVTSSADELVFAATGLPASYTGTASPGSGFTLLRQDTGTSRATDEGKVVNATGSVIGTFRLSASANWTAVVATFSGPTQAGSPTITTASLPDATQNAAYSATLQATGGTLPYLWTTSLGSLPDGLNLNHRTGVISGTPTASGTFNFTVHVSDDNFRTAEKALSIKVNAQGIRLVQYGAAVGSGLSSLIFSPTGYSNTKGNLIIAFVRMSTTTQTVSISDSAGNFYVHAVSQAQTADGHQVHIFYAANIAGGANAVRATFSGVNNYPLLEVYEYSGVRALDRTAARQGWGVVASSGPTTTTSSPDELLFAATGLPASYTGSATPGSGFTLGQENGTRRAASAVEIVTAAGSFTGSFNLSSTANWTAVLVTFRP